MIIWYVWSNKIEKYEYKFKLKMLIGWIESILLWKNGWKKWLKQRSGHDEFGEEYM